MGQLMNTDEQKTLEKKIWRMIPIEAHKLPYTDRMIALQKNFGFKDGRCAYKMPVPETDFEKEIYGQFQNLTQSYDIPRMEYVIPLIKEFVIDNEKAEVAVLFRYQMDFALGKGFQMKEIIFHGKQGEKLKEVFEDHTWTGASSLDYQISRMAKVHVDPMLYLLKGNVFVEDVDFHGLEMDDGLISFFPERGSKII